MTKPVKSTAAHEHAPSSVLYCSCARAELVAAETQAEIRSMLETLDRRVFIVPDLCGMAARRDPLLAQLAAEPRPQIVACFPRAVRCLFDFAEHPLAEQAQIFNQRTMAVDEVHRELAAQRPAPATARIASLGCDDTWVPWYPVIDRDRCTDCGQCASFCLFGVYHRGQDNKVRVAQPASCKNNCPACARICPEVAIIFPKLDEAPLNGDLVSEEAVPPTPIRVDVEGMLGEDVYQALAQRQLKRRRRLLRKSALARADAERQRCSCQGSGPRGLAELVWGRRR